MVIQSVTEDEINVNEKIYDFWNYIMNSENLNKV